ncbi:MAG: CHAT domain-containing protein [Nostoc sp. ChiQUE02]|uniref:CHAT domain-containing tetratricopeptide repeat protein n=1 Tax=Nostoc sp. ChiQUE02 TaxID=3075377 RepID=UPI002AD39C80|nr:CHAT domain-containing protein [Nostoc sp. ChiQUE02]MDZ8235537.1 CHAT domain-containing protein [Nostoc sp. ChiQUE02]
MTKFKICDSRQWQFLPFVTGRAIILFTSILLFSESNVATARQYPANIAQMTQTNDPTVAAAELAYKQGKQLYEQGTAESFLQAIAKFEEALSLYRQVSDRSGGQSLRSLEADTLVYIGKIYSNLGEKQKALDYYKQSLPLSEQVGDKQAQGTTLNNIGKIYSELAEKQKALDYYNQSLSLRRQVGDKNGEAISLNNIGSVYHFLGEKQKALDYYNQSLLLKRQVGNKAGIATTLNNIGKVYLDLGEKQKALSYFSQALSLYQQAKDAEKEGIPTALSNIGTVYLELAEQQKALSYFNQALVLYRQAGDKGGIATALNNIGKAYSNLREHQKALDYYSQSLTLYQQTGNKAREARTLYNIASVQHDGGNFLAALTQIERVIKIVEDLRNKISSQELRTSYFATVQNYYELYIDLLMQLHKQQPSQGYDGLALQTSERARARSLLELLTEANADIRQGVEPKLLSQERDLQQQLDTLEKRRIQILGGNHTEAQAQALEKENEALLEQYKQVQAQIRATSPRYAALTQPQPLSLPQIQQQVLDDNTLLLEYSLGEKRSYVWAVTNKSITSYELPKRADIEATVQKFRQEITTPYLRNSPSIDVLSQQILAPVAQQLEKKRLVVVSDGALQYVPFAALTTGSIINYEPLLLNHEIVTLPSASTLAILRSEHKERKSPPKTLVVLADPIFSSNDERLGGKVQVSHPPVPESNLDNLALTRSAQDSDISFERLRFTRQEAEQILALVPVSDRKQAFDFTASRTTANSENLNQYQIIHFATHGILNSKHPELSGVVLSLFDEKGMPQNGFLRLHDIFNLNLQAELVVLSACQTGLGEEVKGEGLVGLTRGFMYAGSPRVVVSLWSVDDRATSELMKVFYKKMLQEGLKPAAALRTAQIEIWRTQKYAAPYYWAAFTLQGEWK